MPALLPLLWGPGFAPARAQAIDVELVRPSLGRGRLVAVALPDVGPPGTVRVGTVLQYQRGLVDPFDEGGASFSRIGGSLGGSIDLGPLTAAALLPVAASWGGTSADGVGLGDLTLTARWRLLRTRFDTVRRASGPGCLPTGRRHAAFGEGDRRIEGGALAAATLGPLTLAGEAGVRNVGRRRAGKARFPRVRIWCGAPVLGSRCPTPTRVALTAQLTGRVPLAQAPHPLDAADGLLGVDVRPPRPSPTGSPPDVA